MFVDDCSLRVEIKWNQSLLSNTYTKLKPPKDTTVIAQIHNFESIETEWGFDFRNEGMKKKVKCEMGSRRPQKVLKFCDMKRLF